LPIREIFGLSAALVTPFTAQGAVDGELAARHAGWCLANGCQSVTLFGTTGEGPSISAAERTRLQAALRDGGVPADRIVTGVIANSIGDAVAYAREGLDAGGRYVLLAPPSYFKGVSAEGVFNWYAAVFAGLGASARGVILYNIPGVTSVEIGVDLVGRLKAAFPGIIAGVKDSSGDWPYTEKLLAAHRDLAILIGDERSLAAGVRLGGQGAISGMANVAPDRLSTMIAEGRDDEVLSAFVAELVRNPVTPAVKAMVAHRTGNAEWQRVRAPLDKTPAAVAASLGRSMDDAFGGGVAAA